MAIGFKDNTNNSEVAVDGDFKSHSYNETQTAGGQPNVFALKGYEPWVDTIISNPGMNSSYSQNTYMHLSIVVGISILLLTLYLQQFWLIL